MHHVIAMAVLLHCCIAFRPAHADTTLPAMTTEARQQGHVFIDNTTWFVFDESFYNLDPDRVVVTGQFRGWSQDMDDAAWHLKHLSSKSNLWVLAVPNVDGATIGPSTPFKFRVDDGDWISPPPAATNQDGGNLIHRPGVQPVRFRAEILADGSITASLRGRTLDNRTGPSAYMLTDASGNAIAIDRVEPIDDETVSIMAAQSIDPKRVHYLAIDGPRLQTLVRRDGWMRHVSSDKPLGANVDVDRKRTTWGLFAPRASAVNLYLYRDADDIQPYQTLAMNVDDDGVWEASLNDDLHGTYYDFTVHGPVDSGPADPGNFFYETHPVHISDPYSRVVVDSFGKSRVWRATEPATPLRNGRPPMEDVIAYEVHVEDFTNQLPVDESIRGTLPAMVTPELVNRHGRPIGLDYLTDLGINVVHLMPVQEFLHYPDDVWKSAFADDPFMIDAGVNLTNYQWGYRTTHAFAIETRYRQRGTPHGAQRDQFRDLVQAFHDRDIAVIVDLVPNHTGENMDGRHHLFGFNVIDLPYYHRTDDRVAHIGPYGNEIKTEDRPMVRRWLVDQCRHLIDEFGIDGFRIDLAGQIDKQSLIHLRDQLGPDVIVYGEPWIAISDPDVAADPRYGWYKSDAPITFFQDNARNAMKGPTSNPQSKATDRGYAGGDIDQRENAMRAIANSFDDETNPNAGINYLDIHDNWALADRFAVTDWDGRCGVDERRFKLAAGMLMTSLGPIVIHGGTEMMRSKGGAELAENVKTIPADGPGGPSMAGVLHFHGKSDTYNLRRANEFVWDNVGLSRGDSDSPNDYAAMVAYWTGLVELRRSDAGRVFRVGDSPPADYFHWHLPDDQHLLGYTVADRVLVLINTGDDSATFDNVNLPNGKWRLVADADRVDMRGLDVAAIPGGRTHSLSLPPTSLKIWVRNP